jgi:hypothetical protein
MAVMVCLAPSCRVCCFFGIQAASTMFGYAKGELEGKNVSVLMPQPFSGRHNTYLQHYLNTEEPRILNKLQYVVALDKV